MMTFVGGILLPQVGVPQFCGGRNEEHHHQNARDNQNKFRGLGGFAGAVVFGEKGSRQEQSGYGYKNHAANHCRMRAH